MHEMLYLHMESVSFHNQGQIRERSKFRQKKIPLGVLQLEVNVTLLAFFLSSITISTNFRDTQMRKGLKKQAQQGVSVLQVKSFDVSHFPWKKKKSLLSSIYQLLLLSFSGFSSSASSLFLALGSLLFLLV